MSNFAKSIILLLIIVAIMHGTAFAFGYEFTILESLLSGLILGFMSAFIVDVYFDD